MKNLFRFICCGNVDDGKSTLIGRLLLDTGNVKKDQLADALKASKRNGSDKIELAMLLDGLLAEREQQITIDVAHRYFDYSDIRFHILDCPGHVQYTKNMAIAAAAADSGIVVIDAVKGIHDQTRQHINICSLFQLKNICVCLTKSDLLEGAQDKIAALEKEVRVLLDTYHFNYKIIPVSAVTGYNVEKVLETLVDFAHASAEDRGAQTSVIMHMQSSKLYHGSRYYYGKVMAHEPITGDHLAVYPSGCYVTISNTENLPYGCFQIHENIDISQGDCIANCPIIVSNIIKHKTIWFDKISDDMLLKHGTRVVRVKHFTDSVIELDNDIFFNNIEDIKQNGFGIFIDNVTKKTIGCCVFTENKNHQKTEVSGITYWINTSDKEKENEQLNLLRGKFSITPIIFDLSLMEKTVQKNTRDILAVLLAAIEVINSQGQNVIVIGTQGIIPQGNHIKVLTVL